MLDRKYHRHTTLFAILGLVACGATVNRDDSSLDPRFAGPCDRLTLTWAVVQGEEQAAIANREAQLHWVRCEGNTRRSKPLIYAYLALPVDAKDVPVVVTSIPDDGWTTTNVQFADEQTRSVFESMSYSTAAATLALDVISQEAETKVSASIETATGRIMVTGLVNDEITSMNQYRGVLTEDRVAIIAFFGEELFQRAEAAVDVSSAGALFGGLEITDRPNSAVLDRDIRFDRIYWRLPK